MSYVDDITAGIEGLGKWGRVALGAMCAESVLPAVARFAQKGTLHAFEEGLSAAWKSVRNGAVDPRVPTVRAGLEMLPESSCDDSNIPSYNAMVTLGILASALDSIIQKESARRVRESCTLATDYLSGYDHVFRFGNKPRIIDPRKPPPAGALESLQIESQLGAIEKLHNIAGRPSRIVEEMRTMAARISSELAQVLPDYAKKRHW